MKSLRSVEGHKVVLSTDATREETGQIPSLYIPMIPDLLHSTLGLLNKCYVMHLFKRTYRHYETFFPFQTIRILSTKI